MTKHPKNPPLRYGLYGEVDFLLPDFIHCEDLEYQSVRHEMVVKPHLHATLFQIFMVETGKVHVVFEMNQTDVFAGSIVTIPENTMHGLEVSRDVTGLVITVSTSLLEIFFHSSFDILTELATPKVLTQLKDHPLFHAVSQIGYGLKKELQEDLPEKKIALQNYLCLLLTNIYRIAAERSERTRTIESAKTQRFKDFGRNMKDAYSPGKTIKEFAQELHITPEYLNRVCQAIVGKSALHVVHDFFFIEAKRYLKYSGYSITDIAHQLNFEDPAYFSRFFHKMAGCSPKKFRETNVI